MPRHCRGLFRFCHGNTCVKFFCRKTRMALVRDLWRTIYYSSVHDFINMLLMCADRVRKIVASLACIGGVAQNTTWESACHAGQKYKRFPELCSVDPDCDGITSADLFCVWMIPRINRRGARFIKPDRPAGNFI